MSWRPEGYLNPHDTDKDREPGKHWGRARDYEDGWDDCLEALEKRGLKASAMWGDLISAEARGKPGYVVFIPQSEETEEASHD